jgi:hypothetical protein
MCHYIRNMKVFLEVNGYEYFGMQGHVGVSSRILWIHPRESQNCILSFAVAVVICNSTVEYSSCGVQLISRYNFRYILFSLFFIFWHHF